MNDMDACVESMSDGGEEGGEEGEDLIEEVYEYMTQRRVWKAAIVGSLQSHLPPLLYTMNILASFYLTRFNEAASYEMPRAWRDDYVSS